MEKLKGMLKRRSREEAPQIAAMDTSPPDPEGGDTLSLVAPQEDNTRALMMDKIEQLTNEKYSLEDTLSSLQTRLQAQEEENLTLKSKCEDLEQSLEIEKRRFRWQQQFYEKRVRQLTGLDDPEGAQVMEEEEERMKTLKRAQSIEDLLECNNFYEETIKSLVKVQERKAVELNDLKNHYEQRLQVISLEHESDIKEILESSNFEVQKLIGENEGLIRDLLTGCEGLFDELKIEYNSELDRETKTDLKSGEKILLEFRALSTPVKGAVVAGIVVISVATAGWASWGFIIWVWPRLIAFAEVLAMNPESTLMYLMAFLNSVPFQAFLRSWEEGSSLTECLKAFANTEFLTSALRMAPDLFNQFKSFSRRAPLTS